MDEPKPRAITYKEVERAVGEGTSARDVWVKIGEITGAGTPGLREDGNAEIDLTGVSESKVARIEKLLAKDEEPEAAPQPAPAKKSGGKG